MGSLPSPQNERERLEKQLLEEMNAAKKAYRAASEEYDKVRTEFRHMLNHPDGAHAVHQAAKKERLALENYGHALKAFSDLRVHGQRPISRGDPKS